MEIRHVPNESFYGRSMCSMCGHLFEYDLLIHEADQLGPICEGCADSNTEEQRHRLLLQASLLREQANSLEQIAGSIPHQMRYINA